MYSLTYRDQYSLRLESGAANADYLSPAGKGWEYLTESGLLDDIPRLSAEAEQARHVVPVDVGRYDVVCSALAMAALADATLGAATELDRALGYEANAEGSSYLSEPLEMLGAYKVGSTRLNLSADRSTEGALATAPCDDEAVAVETFPLVQRGVLVDYQTTREQASWLAPYYHKIGHPIRSHGCARCEAATSIPMQAAPNLQLLPGDGATTFEDLVAGTEKGLALMTVGSVLMDQQQLNGLVRPVVRQIKNGNRSPDLWKNLTAIGGAGTTRWLGLARAKGQPMQRVFHSVGAVPGKITGMGVIDINRRG
jgi:TldD protein